jgi:hypothetical protein
MNNFIIDKIKLVISGCIVGALLYISAFSLEHFSPATALVITLPCFYVIFKILYSPLYMMRRFAIKIIPVLLAPTGIGLLVISFINSLLQLLNFDPLTDSTTALIKGVFTSIADYRVAIIILIVVGLLAILEQISNGSLKNLFRNGSTWLCFNQEPTDGTNSSQGIFQSKENPKEFTIKFRVDVSANKKEQKHILPKLHTKIVKLCCPALIDFTLTVNNLNKRALPEVVGEVYDFEKENKSSVLMQYQFSCESNILLFIVFIKKRINSKNINLMLRQEDSSHKEYDLSIKLPIK